MSGQHDLKARAVWFAGPRQVTLRDEVAPAPEAAEVRVQTLASALSQGTEMLVFRGEVPEDLPLDLPSLAGSFGFPIKYGYAAVGRVLDCGPDVGLHRPGDLVFVHHPHQSSFTTLAERAIPLPPGLPPVLGVFTANVDTALNVLLDAAPRLGENVVVFGQGVVGLLIAQLLKRAGAGRVLAVEPAAARRTMAEQVGADQVLTPGPHLARQVRELTAGRGADVAIEASGAPAALQAAIEVVAEEGTVVAVSWFGTKSVALDLGGHFHRGRVRLRSSQVGHIDPALAPRWDRRRRLGVALDLLPRLRLEELISHRFRLTDAAAAYELVDQHPEQTVQVVLTYDDGAV